jgi:acetyl-CoA carboxylase biotin carboxyl carrier protein
MPIDVRAHITGTVFKVEVAEGQEVSENQIVITLESMKMEMPVSTPLGGRVARIAVREGQSVEEDDLLLSLE